MDNVNTIKAMYELPNEALAEAYNFTKGNDTVDLVIKAAIIRVDLVGERAMYTLPKALKLFRFLEAQLYQQQDWFPDEKKFRQHISGINSDGFENGATLIYQWLRSLKEKDTAYQMERIK